MKNTKISSLKTAMEQWENLSDISVNCDDETESEFLHFEKGTLKFDIWHWFEAKYNLCIVEDLMFKKGDHMRRFVCS